MCVSKQRRHLVRKGPLAEEPAESRLGSKALQGRPNEISVLLC